MTAPDLGASAEDFFLHGGDYPDHVDDPRPKRCSTCAFRRYGLTVRPADTSLRTLIHMTADYDSFVCHQLHDGVTLTCRAWLAHHRPSALIVQREHDAATPPRGTGTAGEGEDTPGPDGRRGDI